MNHRYFPIRIMLIALIFLISACGPQTAPVPTSIPTTTLTSVPPTITPTLTPSPEPTSTPTDIPTPIGGKNGLLLHQVTCLQEGNCTQTIFLYNLVSHELVKFLEGYIPLDVSPDEKKVLLLKLYKSTIGIGDLFILDSALPEQINLLQENVEDAVWLGDSDWIGLISKVNGKRQGFILHPDGSELTQITKSPIGVVEIKPVFNDSIFWSEGTISQHSISRTGDYLTKLDGTQTKFINFEHVAPNMKYVITRSMNGRDHNLMDIATGETKEISLSKPDLNVDFPVFSISPLTEDKWLVGSFPQTLNTLEYWIFSSDGTLMAKLPNNYRVVNPSDPPQPYDLLSPDGVWVLIEHYEKISNKQSKVTYYLFNTNTSEIKELPNLYAIETGAKIEG